MTASDNDTVSLTVVLSSEHLSDLEVGPILDAIAQQFTAQNITQALCVTFSVPDEAPDSGPPSSGGAPASQPAASS